jgi:hypothetical protein
VEQEANRLLGKHHVIPRNSPDPKQLSTAKLPILFCSGFEPVSEFPSVWESVGRAAGLLGIEPTSKQRTRSVGKSE